jgi:hypothetical protein
LLILQCVDSICRIDAVLAGGMIAQELLISGYGIRGARLIPVGLGGTASAQHY